MSVAGGPANPLYSHLEAVLAEDIANGVLTSGSQLPTEDQLIERFHVSRTTVRKAIQNLAARGLIEIRRGKGTFVTEPKITQDLTELSGFVEDMRALGRHPSAKLLAAQVVAADETVARQLGLLTGTSVMRIHRVRLADGTPVSFDETYLPLELGRKVAAHDLTTEPIFSLLEEKYDVPLMEAEYRLEAVAATDEVAQALGIEPRSPIFRIERTSFRTGGQPVDYEKLHYRGDLVRFVTRLSRNRSSQNPKTNA
jgi:GntR family transcriptional regulator